MHAERNSVCLALDTFTVDVYIGVVDVRFEESQLERLEVDATFDAGLPQGVVTAFRRRMQQIRAAVDERAFYNLKSLHFEKLQGARSHQHSMRLNDQWRLIIQFEGKAPNKVVVIVSVEDYH
jgi:toxin HigB-1